MFVVVSLAVLANMPANASVRYELAEIRCEEKLRYFRWRSFSVTTPEEMSRAGDGVYRAAPPFESQLASAGFYTTGSAYCRFDSFVDGSIGLIEVFEVPSDDSNGRNRSVEVVVNGVEMFSIDNVWRDNEFTEHLVEITNVEGRYCGIQFDKGAFYQSSEPQQLLTDPAGQKMICRFFRVPAPKKSLAEEGR
ncbi:MAG: hypothetical protein AAF720_02880 [Pseudomonadota bacterium]